MRARVTETEGEEWGPSFGHARVAAILLTTWARALVIFVWVREGKSYCGVVVVPATEANVHLGGAAPSEPTTGRARFFGVKGPHVRENVREVVSEPGQGREDPINPTRVGELVVKEVEASLPAQGRGGHTTGQRNNAGGNEKRSNEEEEAATSG
jgi:hypothetical protein